MKLLKIDSFLNKSLDDNLLNEVHGGQGGHCTNVVEITFKESHCGCDGEEELFCYLPTDNATKQVCDN